MHGVFLEWGSVSAGDLECSALKRSLESWDFFETSEESEMADRIAGAQVAVVNKLPVTTELLQQCASLELLCVSATGIDNIDVTACRDRGVTVCNARNYATPSVVQHTWALILSLVTHQRRYVDNVRDGVWSAQPQFALLEPVVEELDGKTLGIVGCGTLGSAVAAVASAFGMRVSTWARPGGQRRENALPLNDLLDQADVLSLHCPLNDQTRGLIDGEALRRLGSESWLINTARGGIVDEAALIDAVTTGKIAGAGVDVLTTEPPSPDHPLVAARLPNLLVTPHSAWAARASRQRLIDQIADNIASFRAGRPLREV